MQAIAEYTISAIYDGDSYVIQPSVSSVVIEDSGTYNPSEITFNNKHKQGNGELENYSGRLKIETTSDNTNWTTQYTSSSNEASKTYSLPSATVDKEPYNFRKSPVTSGSKSGTIIGGSLAWNQLIDGIGKTVHGVAITVSNGKFTFTGTASSSGGRTNWLSNNDIQIVNGHKYLAYVNGNTDASNLRFYITNKSSSSEYLPYFSSSNIIASEITAICGFGVNLISSVEYNNTVFIQLIDLTTLFGNSTIADYVYSLEQSTSGAGVAWLRKYFPKIFEYHEYDSGTMVHVSGLQSHDVVGLNQWDEEWEIGNISTSDGTDSSDTNRIRSVNYIPVFSGETYYFKAPATIGLRYYNADKHFIGFTSVQANTPKTIPDNCCYLRFIVVNTTEYANDICINLSDPSRNGTYESYDPHSYPLDSSLTLRGVPKLVTDHIEFDGDKYRADGSVERRYGVVDLGTLNWTIGNHATFGAYFYATISGAKYIGNFTQYAYNAICEKYTIARRHADYFLDKTFVFDGSNATGTVTQIQIKDSSYTDAATFKTAMSGQYLVYELATTTTETAQPFQSPMVVGTTEEYVSNSIVPVGHETKYTSDIKNIRASLYKAGGTTALLNQITIPVLSQEDFKPKLINTIRQYTKSTSSISLPSNPTWVDDEEPTIGDNEYMWARLKHVYSDGTFVYSNAVCSTSISGAIHDVDKANKSITDKVWESDITTKINQYDGSTVSTIRDRVTSTEQNISGITSRVSDVESSVTDEANQRKATFGTCDTGAGTAAKAVTCENFELHAGSIISVKFTNTNTTASPTLNVNSTGAKTIKSYTGQDLTEGEYKWAAGSVYDFIYDGQYWRLSDSGSLKRITSAESSITQNATNIELKVSKDGVISSINQSAEAVTINADKVNIEGAAIFSSGRLSQTNLNNAYDSKGSAAAVQTNLDNLEIGGRNLFKDSTNLVNGWVLNHTTVSDGIATIDSNTTENARIYQMPANGYWVYEKDRYYTVSVNAKGSTDTSKFTFSAIGGGNIYSPNITLTTDWKRYTWTFQATADGTGSFSFFAVNNTGTIYLSKPKLEYGNKPTSWTPAPEDQFASTVPCYYRKTTSGAPSAPSSTIGTSNNTDNTWTYVMPLPKKNCYFFTCEEYTNVGGTKSYSTVRALDSQTYTSKWVSSSDQTYIDGGSIYTHSITTNQLATDAIKSTNYLTGGSNSPYSSAGTFLDLSNGNFYTPNFGVQSTGTTAAFINGEIIATSGRIGEDANTAWTIGTYRDFEQNDHGAIISNGDAFIQAGKWMISNDRIDTKWYDNTLKTTYIYDSNTYYYYDYGINVPDPSVNYDPTEIGNTHIMEDTFLYIRKSSSKNVIPSSNTEWDYLFRVSKNGTIYINGVAVSGTDGDFLSKSAGGTVSGNVTITGTLTATASKANQLTHSISVNGKAFDGSANVTVGTIGAAYGGTGQTSLKAAGTAIIGALDTNTTTPVDNDYIATGSSTFYRKTISKLWDYIKGKLSADHSNLDSLYVQKSGDIMTGSLTVENGIYADSAQVGNLIISGSGRFANGLYGNLIGNADTATKAAKISDTGDGSEITISINKPQLSTTNFIAAWDGHEIRAISPANLLTTIGADKSASISDRINATGSGKYNWKSATYDDKLITSNTLAFWNGAYDSSSHASNIEYVKAGKLGDIVTHNVSEFLGASANAVSATKATQDGNGNTISSTYLKLSGGVLTKADGVTFTANAGDVVYVNPNSIIQSPISGSLWHDLWAFCGTTPKYYTTTNGTTWTEATLEKRLFAHLENWGNVNVISSTISGSRWEWDNGGFAYSNGYWLVFGITYSATVAKFDVILESSNETGESATWTTLMSSTGVSVNQQPVWIRCNGSAQNNLRLTIKRNSASDNTTNLPVCSIRLLSSRWGNQGKGKEYEYPYTWDGEGNITAKGTFTGTFNGNATSATSATSATTATKLNSTRSFTIGNTAKNVDWSGAVSYSKAEISDEASSTANGWMSVADKKKLDSITVSDIGTIGANSIRGEKDIKVTISSGVATIGHENSAITAGTISGTATSTLSNGGSFKIPSITYDAYGHITGTAQTTITLPNITSVSSATTATKFNTSRTISLSGDISGTATADGSNGWAITTTVTDDSHNHTVDTIVPKLSKTYTNIVAPANDDPNGWLYFAKFKPVDNSTTVMPYVKYRIRVEAAGRTDSYQDSYVEYWMFGSDVRGYSTFNKIKNTSYRAMYNHSIYRATSTGITNGYGHLLGIRFTSSWNPATAANSRTVIIDIIETKDCTIEFLDDMVLYANASGTGSTNYVGRSDYDGTTQGITISGDRNDSNTVLRAYYTIYKTYAATGRYKLMLSKDEEYLIPINSTNNDLGTSKTLTTEAFDPFGEIYYYSYTNNRAANTSFGTNELIRQQLIDLRYSFNCGGNTTPASSTLVARKALYLVATPQTNGTAKLYTQPLSQDLPSSDNGLIYIYLGQVYPDTDPYRVDLSINHPIYWYKNGAVRQFTGVETGTTFTGAVNFANNTLNLIGDDAYLGDQNVAGCVVIKGKNGASGIQFNPYSGSTSQKISIDGSGNMTITGNIVSDATGTLGSTANPFHQLVLGGATNATVDATSTNPRITFQEGTGTQPVHLIYSDYDNYRSPAGLKITGDSNASSSPAWLEVEGTVYAPTFSGTATKATADASGNTITSYYCTLSTNQTISGTKTFSAMPLASAGICVNSDGSGTAGGVSLWSDKNVDQYGLALRTTANGGKHGFVQGDFATYSYMYASSGNASLTRGWVFKNNRVSTCVASINAEGKAVFNGSITVGGNATNTSGCRQEFDSTLNCLNFIFN